MSSAERKSTAKKPRASGTGVGRATGREREEWFALLDDWGAAGRAYREIADWLTSEHDLSRWWAQKLIVEYQQARGLRPPGVRPDRTFTVTASKTVGVPLERLFKAFVDPKVRRRWLPGAVMRKRAARPGHSARFDWEGGASRVSVGFTAQGKAKSQAGVQHERLPDAKSAEEAKAYWRERLAALKALLEA
jgi:hypothetical protein